MRTQLQFFFSWLKMQINKNKDLIFYIIFALLIKCNSINSKYLVSNEVYLLSCGLKLIKYIVYILYIYIYILNLNYYKISLEVSFFWLLSFFNVYIHSQYWTKLWHKIRLNDAKSRHFFSEQIANLKILSQEK
jgi:hypothetical protein